MKDSEQYSWIPVGWSLSPARIPTCLWLLRRGEKEWRKMPLEFSHAENSRGIGVADMAAAIAAGREHRANERMAYHVLDLMHSMVDASEPAVYSEMRKAMSRPRAATGKPADGKSRILGG